MSLYISKTLRYTDKYGSRIGVAGVFGESDPGAGKNYFDNIVVRVPKANDPVNQLIQQLIDEDAE